ncbi:MFS transporter [Streptomyces litchfieldiae]|uniref:MFS transporter n=1 Tax=Streptomyces litchfieldiae TaxID=3075543 RepID=A0ABU2ML76_9ACTN|nr:MFS transporter [Streptomyces sp. DSM 44938]MDT0342280.1 hypothetical protein [Streptomyces sp. DSM 44938]
MTSPTLARDRAYLHWSAGAQAGRLPAAMAPLAFTTLTVTTTGSYRLGALMMSVFVVAQTLGAVPTGRLLDRLGAARGVTLLACCAAAAFAALTAAARAGAPPLALLALVAAPGLIAGGLSGGFRSLLAGAVDEARIVRAVAVDAMLVDAILVAGPVLVAVLTPAGALLPLLVMAGAYAASAALMATLPLDAPPPRRERKGERPPLPLRRAVPWFGCNFAIGHVLSTVEVAPLPLAGRLGAGPAGAAVVLAALCGASIAGSALFAWRGRPRRAGAIAFLGCFAAGSLFLAAGTGGWPGLLAAVVLVGACTGPLLTTASVSLQRLLPAERRAEGFSVAFVIQGTGFGLGSLTVGALPLHLAHLLAAATALAACALIARPRPELTAPSGATPSSSPGTPAAATSRDRRASPLPPRGADAVPA